jgi:hypothetical protein
VLECLWCVYHTLIIRGGNVIDDEAGPATHQGQGGAWKGGKQEPGDLLNFGERDLTIEDIDEVGGVDSPASIGKRDWGLHFSKRSLYLGDNCIC